MSTKRRRTRRSSTDRAATDRAATTDVVTQLEVAIRNPHAAAIGALIGGLVPWFGRTLAHGEIQEAWFGGSRALTVAMLVVVLGCAVFSGMSVYKFGKAAFSDPRKALGFVLALEGVMLVSHGITSTVALMVLILINAVANGSVIALARDAACKRRNADARGVATRAAHRATARACATVTKSADPATCANSATVINSSVATANTEATQPLYTVPAVAVVPATRALTTTSAPAPRALARVPFRLKHSSRGTVIDAEIISEARLLA